MRSNETCVSNNILISNKLEKNRRRIMRFNESDISDLNIFLYFFLVFTRSHDINTILTCEEIWQVSHFSITSVLNRRKLDQSI